VHDLREFRGVTFLLLLLRHPDICIWINRGWSWLNNLWLCWSYWLLWNLSSAQRQGLRELRIDLLSLRQLWLLLIGHLHLLIGMRVVIHLACINALGLLDSLFKLLIAQFCQISLREITSVILISEYRQSEHYCRESCIAK
jgi:hypothetical protein